MIKRKYSPFPIAGGIAPSRRRPTRCGGRRRRGEGRRRSERRHRPPSKEGSGGTGGVPARPPGGRRHELPQVIVAELGVGAGGLPAGQVAGGGGLR